MMPTLITLASRPVTLLAVASLTLSTAPARAQERQQPPAPGPLRPYAFPEVERFTLANGLQVIVVERSTLPIVTARVIVDAGSMREPAAKNGLAALTGNLLSEGTRTLTGAQIAERMERLGAQFSTSGSYSLASVDVTALKPVFSEAMALAATTLLEPSFPEGEFNRLRSEAIAAYRQRLSRAEGIASDLFYVAAFDASAPFSRPPQGTPATIGALTRDDVVAWHRAMYAPASTTVLIAGDITVDEARSVVQRAFGGWRAAASTLALVTNPRRAAPATRVILIDRPGSVQSAIRIGQPGLLASDPQYLSMLALNHVLGGAVSSRLNMNLRERHGYTYGAFSGLDLRTAGGAFSLSSSVRTDATDSALVEAMAEYRRIVAEPVPGSELQGAVNNLVASFPSSVQTVQALLGRMQNLVLWGLPLDFYGTYRERLTSVSPADVQQAGQRYLTPDNVVIVVAGDLSRIEQPIRARNLGAVEVWDTEGKRVR